MLTSPTSIRIVVEAGKSAILHARGIAALAVATGVGMAMVKTAQQITGAADSARQWIVQKILE